jgi:maltokinase
MTTATRLANQLEPALARWLPTQRWFGGKGRSIAWVELVRTVEVLDRLDHGGPLGVLALARVRFADGRPELYQVPLGLREAAVPEPIATVAGLAVYDGTTDPVITTELLCMMSRDEWRDGVHFGPERSGGHAFAIRLGMPVRPLGAEQSNTSVVFGERFVLKLFRRLAPGINPDLELHRALHAGHSQHVAPLLGAVETEHDGEPLTLGMLSSFAAGATDGWDLATTDLRDRLGGAETGMDVEAEAGRLGQVVAEVHAQLAAALGGARMTRVDAAVLSEGMQDRFAAAVRDVPALAQHLHAACTVFRAADAAGQAVHRIHGDLHLGQVLRTPNRWLLVDFEGEPAAPLAERVVPQSPLRDVAGMLRSFDYAAATELRTHTGPEHSRARATARDWLSRARAGFLHGYGESAGVDPAGHAALLAAYELDKAVYEVRYETRHRPHLAELPLAAVRRLTGKPHEVSAPATDLFE